MSDTDDNSNYNEMSFAGSSDGTPHVRRAGSATGSVESYTSNGGRRRQSSIASADSHRYEEESTNPLVAAVRKITRPLKHFWSQGAVEQRIVEVVAIAGTSASEARLSQMGGGLCGSAPGLFAAARPV